MAVFLGSRFLMRGMIALGNRGASFTGECPDGLLSQGAIQPRTAVAVKTASAENLTQKKTAAPMNRRFIVCAKIGSASASTPPHQA